MITEMVMMLQIYVVDHSTLHMYNLLFTWEVEMERENNAYKWVAITVSRTPGQHTEESPHCDYWDGDDVADRKIVLVEMAITAMTMVTMLETLRTTVMILAWHAHMETC